MKMPFSRVRWNYDLNVVECSYPGHLPNIMKAVGGREGGQGSRKEMTGGTLTGDS